MPPYLWYSGLFQGNIWDVLIFGQHFPFPIKEESKWATLSLCVDHNRQDWAASYCHSTQNAATCSKEPKANSSLEKAPSLFTAEVDLFKVIPDVFYRDKLNELNRSAYFVCHVQVTWYLSSKWFFVKEKKENNLS